MIKRNLILLSVLVLIFKIAIIPIPTYAALNYSGLVQCDGVVDAKDEPGRNVECNFSSLVNSINYIIIWLFRITIPLFVALLAYAGFLYMTPNPSNRQLAGKMLWTALNGFVIMLVAYFMVYTVLKWIVNPKFKGADALLEIKK